MTKPRRRRVAGYPAAVLVLLFALLAATRAPARSTPLRHHDASAHGATAAGLYRVPHGAPSAALHAAGVRMLARYASFDLVQAAPADASGLIAAGATRSDELRTVELQGRAVDPAAEELRTRTRGERSGLPADGAPRLAIVQYVGPIKDAWRDALAATGARVVSYLAENAYLVHTDGDAGAALAAYAGSAAEIRGAFVPSAGAKLADLTPDTGGLVRVAVQTLSGEDGEHARLLATGEGQKTAPPTSSGPYRTLHLLLTPAEAAGLGAQPGVVAIEPDGRPQLLDERQDLALANGTVGPSPGGGYLAAHDAALFGSGETPATLPFVIDVSDSAIDTGLSTPTSNDLRTDGLPGGASRLAYVHKFTDAAADPASVQGCDGHGTINASIIGGYDTTPGAATADGAGFSYGLGVEPRALIGSSTVFRCDTGANMDTGGQSLTQVASSAYLADGPGHDGARIQNNSWGSAGTAGAYDATAQEFDAIVRDAVPSVAGSQPLVEVVSAGNSGSRPRTINSPGSAKNVITVGASESVRASGTDGCGYANSAANNVQEIASFSSRGPTADGRLKPDLVAPGTHVSGIAWRARGTVFDGHGVCGIGPSGTFGSQFSGTDYTTSSGTSHSAPAVAGLAAAARSSYQRTTGVWPSPAMVKAMLIGGATGLSGAGAGSAPNAVQGFGLARLAGAATGGRWLSDQQRVFDQSGESFTRTFAPLDSAKPVRVTLVWTDAPGPLLGSSYVNDLDLEVTAGGATYRGNNLVSGTSVPDGSPDPRDNVESIVLPAGAAAQLAVRVRAANIAGDGVPGGDTTDQDFALVVQNVGAPTGAAALDAGGARIVDEDGDGVLEPREPFEVRTRIANSGDAPAANVQATLSSATTGVALSSAAADLGTLGPGGSAEPSPVLGGTLGPQSCGEASSVRLTLSASAPGAVGVSTTLTMPGAGSTPRAAIIPPSGIAVPDPPASQPTPVSLSISDAGTVRDLKVELTDIRHPWLEDLQLTLRSPSGTSVMLLDQVGGDGAGHSGRDLQGTILDDDAATSIQSVQPVQEPYTGHFRPLQPLATFDGEPLAGTWTLEARDVTQPDSGRIYAFALLLPACNVAPKAELSAAPSVVATGEQLTLDASASLDRDDPIASYGWDLDGDGTVDRTTTAATTTTSFSAGGVRQPAVTVTDARGAWTRASASVVVKSSAPASAPAPVPGTATPPAAPTPAPSPAPATPRTTSSSTTARLVVTGLPALRSSCPRPASSAMRVRAPSGVTLTKVAVYVDRGLRRSVVGGSKLRARISLGRQPARAHVVRVVARTSRGRTLRYERRYPVCRSSR